MKIEYELVATTRYQIRRKETEDGDDGETQSFITQEAFHLTDAVERCFLLATHERASMSTVSITATPSDSWGDQSHRTTRKQKAWAKKTLALMARGEK